MNRSDSILGHIKENTSIAAQKFDEYFGDRVQEFSSEAGSIFADLDSGIVGNVGEPLLSDHAFQGSQLLWGGLTSLIGAMEILRMGYWKDAGIIARSALETGCCGLHMSQNVDMFTKFRRGETNYSAAVSFASKLSRTIPRTYGLLSEMYTHTSQLHGVLHFDRTTGLDMFPVIRDGDLHRYAKTLLALEMTLGDLGQIYEFMFYEKIDEPKHWEKNEKGALQWKPNDNIGDKYMRRHIEAELLAQEKMGDRHQMQLPPKEILERLGYSHLAS